jgi:hypothetical protein
LLSCSSSSALADMLISSPFFKKFRVLANLN